MKFSRLFACTIMGVLFMQCSKDNCPGTTAPQVLTFTVDSHTRSNVNYTTESYFGLEGMSRATVLTSRQESDYTYLEGVLSPTTKEDNINFAVDGSPIPSVSVFWPSLEVRSEQGDAVPTDQSDFETFFSADWLKTELKNVSYQEKVPIELGHERAKVIFELSGSLVNKKITSLEIGGMKAFCDAAEDVVCAQMILIPGVQYVKTGDFGSLYYEGNNTPQNFTIVDFPELVSGEYNTIKISL